MTNLTILQSQFSGDIVTPGHPDYVTSIARWAANAQRRAKVVAFVKSTSDVALAISYARESQLEIAIRGGGHSPAGASSTEDGLVIDLSRYMNSVEVDEQRKLAYVGGGALWGTVDKEAIKHGLATVGGTVNHTGVGGLTLGGGYGWLTGRHGLTIDNLVQATVVTASGSVVTASATSHPDLFFGIRGGGSNFGVVTEFVYRLHPQRRTVYSGHLVFASEALERIVDVTRDWWMNVGEDEGLIETLTIGPDGKPIIICFLFYNGSEAEGRNNFKNFLDIGPVVDSSKEMPYEDINGLFNDIVSYGQGAYTKSIVQSTPHYPSTIQAQSHIIHLYNQHLSGPKFIPAVSFEYIPLAKYNSVPQGETAFRRDPTPNVLILAIWNPTTKETVNLGEGEKANLTIARKWAHEVEVILKNGQVGVTEVQWMGYSNHDSDGVITMTGQAETQNVVEERVKKAFAGNYPRLQQVKRMYDPERLFNKWFPIVPAIAQPTRRSDSRL